MVKLNKTKAVIYGAIILLGCFALWVIHRSHDVRVDRGISSRILPAEDREKLIIDPVHHTIEILNRRPNGETQIQKKYLNPRGATAIEEKQDGALVITQRAYGTELTPLLGFTVGSDIRLRAAVGANVFYIQRFDIGAGMLLSSDAKDTRGMVDVSYNFYDNLSVGAYVDNRKNAGVICTLRI